MAASRKGVSLGPYTRKQKLYLETEDGQAMEGEFVKMNASIANPSVLLHRVEFIPSDGRVFEQYNALLSELVCLRPLENPSGNVSADNTSVEEESVADPPSVVEKPLEDSASMVEKPLADPKDTTASVLPDVAARRETTRQTAEQLEGKRISLCEMLAQRGLMNDIHPDVLKSIQKPIQMRPRMNNSLAKQPVEELKKDVATPSYISSKDCDESCEKKVEKAEVNGVKASDAPPIPTNGTYEALKSKAKGYFIVDKPGELLQTALKDIEKRSIIGLGSHGSDKGRLDRLSMLTVATDSAVYLIDIQTLGKQAFQKPLLTALQSTTVEKVTYDCRYLSDCLYYTHQVRLQNVYDVQAADCVLHRCRKGSFQNRGRSLQEILAHYLDLPAALLTDNTNISNYKVWYQRPLQDECYDFASWQVAPLLQLRTAIDKAFQNLMLNSFDVYLCTVRKLRRPEFTESLASRRQIPLAAMDAPFTRDS